MDTTNLSGGSPIKFIKLSDISSAPPRIVSPVEKKEEIPSPSLITVSEASLVVEKSPALKVVEVQKEKEPEIVVPEIVKEQPTGEALISPESKEEVAVVALDMPHAEASDVLSGDMGTIAEDGEQKKKRSKWLIPSLVLGLLCALVYFWFPTITSFFKGDVLTSTQDSELSLISDQGSGSGVLLYGVGSTLDVNILLSTGSNPNITTVTPYIKYPTDFFDLVSTEIQPRLPFDQVFRNVAGTGGLMEYSVSTQNPSSSTTDVVVGTFTLRSKKLGTGVIDFDNANTVALASDRESTNVLKFTNPLTVTVQDTINNNNTNGGNGNTNGNNGNTNGGNNNSNNGNNNGSNNNTNGGNGNTNGNNGNINGGNSNTNGGNNNINGNNGNSNGTTIAVVISPRTATVRKRPCPTGQPCSAFDQIFTAAVTGVSTGQGATTWAMQESNAGTLSPYNPGSGATSMSYLAPTRTGTFHVLATSVSYPIYHDTAIVRVVDCLANNDCATGQICNTTTGQCSTTGEPVIMSFTATPTTITNGGSSTLSWNVTGSGSIAFSINGQTVTGNTMIVRPTTTTAYTLTATNVYGTRTATTTVTVSSGGGGGGGGGVLYFYDCVNQQCIRVAGRGSNTCTTNADCTGNRNINSNTNSFGGGTGRNTQPRFLNIKPNAFSVGNPANPLLTYEIQDVDNDAIVPSSVKMRLNGKDVIPTITGNGSHLFVAYQMVGSLASTNTETQENTSWFADNAYAQSVATSHRVYVHLEAADIRASATPAIYDYYFVIGNDDSAASFCTTPITLQGTTTSTRVTLSWNPSTDARVSGYTLRVGEDQTNLSRVEQLGKISTVTLTGFTTGKTYYYVLTAIGNCAESNYSNMVALHIGTGTAAGNYSPGRRNPIVPDNVLDESMPASLPSTGLPWNVIVLPALIAVSVVRRKVLR